MFTTLKDYASAAFYMLGAAVAVGLIFFMGVIVLIPALFYGTYHILRIRRQMRNKPEQSNAKLYTSSDNHRPESHKDRQ